MYTAPDVEILVVGIDGQRTLVVGECVPPLAVLEIEVTAADVMCRVLRLAIDRPVIVIDADVQRAVTMAARYAEQKSGENGRNQDDGTEWSHRF